MAVGCHRIVLAFRGYRRDAELEVARWEHNFGLLPPHHQQLLGPRQLLKFSAARQCIQVNSFFIASMLATFEEDEEGGGPPSHLAKANRAADAVAAKAGHRPSFEDYGKVGEGQDASFGKGAFVGAWVCLFSSSPARPKISPLRQHQQG